MATRTPGLEVGLAALLAVLLAACAPEEVAPEEPDAVTVGMVVKALDQEFWLALRDASEAAAEAEDVELHFEAPADELAVDEQLDIIEDMITRRVDALVVAPVAPDPAVSAPVLEEALEQDIPVLLVDTDMPAWDGHLTFIGTDNVAAGRAAGEHIGEELGGAGTMAILGGVPGVTSVEERTEGVREVVQQAGIEIVAEVSAESDRGLARDVMDGILASSPDVDALFAANDEMALGALQALEAIDREPDDLVVVGFDATSEAAQAILDGDMDASVAQMIAAMGAESVEQAARAARGEEIEPRIDTGYELVTEENAEGYID